MIANRPGSRSPRRAGFGLIEMAITGLMIAAAMAATVQVVAWVAVDRRAAERRQRAAEEAANLLERIAARPWDELTAESLGRSRLTEGTAAFLPGSRLDVGLATIREAPERKRITVEVRWNDRSGRPEAPVRLVAWAHRRAEGAR